MAESFQPDHFQREAMRGLDEGASVLVAAPTGSGKTFIAEHAIRRALADKKKAFYTAPIKALSNQKFRDFQSLFGTENVGLLTGDTSVNSDAPIMVMTTEVLRNMIYASSHSLNGLAVVVLDEVHFLQDQYRGPVWEEVIIHLPLEVALVCLSATVSNAVEVAEWLTLVRGDTRAIVETKRPVSLEHHHAAFDKATGQLSMVPVLMDGKVSPRAKKLFQQQAMPSAKGGGHGHKRQRQESRFAPPTRTEVVAELARLQMLPAIFFIFSRNQCDDAARGMRRTSLSFVSTTEAKEIRRIAETRAETLSKDELSALDFEGFVSLISTGVAAHHAGMVPTFKEIVEEAFTRGLIKVVFATETLAVGLNMPARSVVIDKLTRFTGENHIPLKPSDFTQLTGRAGRRGIDSVGHAVTLWSPFVSFDEVARFALNKSFELTSAFRPTYNMTVNLVRSHAEKEVRHLLNLSFAQYQSNSEVVLAQARIERKREALAVEIEEATSQYGDIWEYRMSHGLADKVKSSFQAENERHIWETLRPGDVITARTDEALDQRQKTGEKFLIIATAARKRGLKITVVDTHASVRGMLWDDLFEPPRLMGRIELPKSFSQWDPGVLRSLAHSLSEFVPSSEHQQATTAVIETNTNSVRLPLTQDEIDLVEADPLLQRRLKHAKAADRIRDEISRMETALVSEKHSVGSSFDVVLGLLGDMGFVRGWALTNKGSVLAGVFHECDLLIAEAINEGIFNGLGPTDLAAALSCVVFERRGGDQDDSPLPSQACRSTVQRLEDLSMKIQDLEAARGLPVHRFPDPNFAIAASRWAAGNSLTKVLDSVPEMSPGDFVRTVRQIVDLLRQIERVADDDALRRSAKVAGESMFRGLVVGSELLA